MVMKGNSGSFGLFGSRAALTIALLAIFFSTSLQFSRLTSVNTGFFCDEASILFNARCLLEDGRDEHGILLPFFFEAFGEYKSGFYIYGTAIVNFFFDLDPHAGARVGACVGLGLMLLGVFFLVKLHTNAWIGLFGVLLTASQPWFMHYSQIGFELTLTPLFLVGGILFWDYGCRGRPKFLILSSLFFAGAFYNYAAARVFTPLLIPFLVFFYRGYLGASRRMVPWAIISVVLYVSAITPFFINAFMIDGFLSRAEYLDVFRTPWIDRSAGYSYISSLPDGWLKTVVLENDFLTRLSAAICHYIFYYSPEYLFFSGDNNLRFGTPHYGVFGSFNLIGFGAGILLLLFKRSPLNNVLICWLVFYGIAGSLTWEDIPHSGRGITAHPGLDLVVIFGWGWIFQFIKKNALISKPTKIFSILSLVFFSLVGGYSYWNYQNSLHGTISAKWMQYGVRDMLRYVEREQEKYRRVYLISTELYYRPEIFALVYSGIRCGDWLTNHKLPWKLIVRDNPPTPYELEQGDLYIYAPPPARADPLLRKVAEGKWPSGVGSAWVAFHVPIYDNPPEGVKLD
jgi:hypothetical protein